MNGEKMLQTGIDLSLSFASCLAFTAGAALLGFGRTLEAIAVLLIAIWLRQDQ